MVYNRLVAFALEAPNHRALRHAYLDNAVVVTPNPRVHALMADKRNLILLSDARTLRDGRLNDAEAGYLEKAVPETRLVSAEDAETLWSNRRRLFFKPVAGHGSKGVYRGEKVTTREVDIRLYTYAGQLLLAAARVYQGQATNFRTPGGGFAPVFQV